MPSTDMRVSTGSSAAPELTAYELVARGGRVIGVVRLPTETTWIRRSQLSGDDAPNAVMVTPAPPPKQDIDDYARAHGLDATRRAFDADVSRPQPNTPRTWRESLINPQVLCDEQFPEVRYVVPRIIPEGVTLLASRPKLGKSWLILQVATAIATGSVTLAASDHPEHGDVLYLALEDNARRLQRRLTKYFGGRREILPRRLGLTTTWRRLDLGGLDDLREWCRSVSKPVLIAIDTLKKVRKPKGRNQSDYDADYEACEGLVRLTKEFAGLSIIVAHHDRKMDADDVFDTVSGTLGLTGGVDTIAIVKRSTKGTTLHVEGRDVPETIEKALNFDRETCRWQILGEAIDIQRSAERSRVLTALRGAPDGLSVQELIGVAGLGGTNAAYLLLGRMVEAGDVERVRRGVYGMPGTRVNLSRAKRGQNSRQDGN